MDLESLKKLVVEEAKKLKKNATPEELSNLYIGELIPTNSRSCIYGQMTGSCFSPRALHLLKLCAKPTSTGLRLGGRGNIVPKGSVWEDFVSPPSDLYNDRSAFSPIEMYITLWGVEGNQNLIDFLKGDKETLTVKDL